MEDKYKKTMLQLQQYLSNRGGEFTRLTANVHDLYVRGFYSFNFEGPHGGMEACWHLLENI